MTVRRIALALVAALLAAAFVGIYAGPIQRITVPITERFLPKAVLRLPRAADDKFIVLTIDDAPSSRTGEILDLLKRHNAQATFFVHGGQIAGREAALVRLAAEGHDIGHHMWRDRPAFRLSQNEFDKDFAKTDAALAAYGSAKRPYFRPPHGAYRAGRMDPTLARLHYHQPLAVLGSQRHYILASFIPWDAGGATNTGDQEKDRQAAKRYSDQLLANLYPGAIVVFHDGEEEDRDARLDATIFSLERFLKGATANGYDVLSLSEGVTRAAKNRATNEL